MGRIKIVLLFNEDDERQNEVGKFLRTQQRCKTALITSLLYDWLKRQKASSPADYTLPGKDTDELAMQVKNVLLSDTSFVNQIYNLVSEQNTGTEEVNTSGKESCETHGVELDIDEDMLLAGMSIFEGQL